MLRAELERLSSAAVDCAADSRALRVLLVEDNEDIGDMLALLLERWGHRVTLRREGRSGLAAGLAAPHDLALLDLGLPGIDGYELARSLRRALGTDAPVMIAISGYAQPEDVAAAHRAGFDQHLAKPVDDKTIQAVLGRARRAAED
jgi:CheY-like chemotaxis protein